MKLTIVIKLLPTDEQAQALEDTLKVANEAANVISETAWEQKSFGQYKLHRLTYEVKASFNLSAQMVVRTIAKVADAYKLDERTKRTFKPLGAIAYDNRILRYCENAVSIWTVTGREHIPFICDQRSREMLRFRQGESDLIFRSGKWYLLAMARDVNHRISKEIVRKAQGTKRGISLENLKGIRARITARKSQRRTAHSWSFSQLQRFVEYKAKLAGVPVLFIDPRNTSRTCPECGHVDKRNRPTRDRFSCVSCSFAGEADATAAENIRRAAVNQPDVVCENPSHNYKLTPLGVGS